MNSVNYTSAQKKNLKAEIFNINKTLKDINMAPGNNPLLEFFSWQRKHRINSFFESLCPDFLRTVVKGIVEYAMAWCVAI